MDSVDGVDGLFPGRRTQFFSVLACVEPGVIFWEIVEKLG